MEEPVLPPDPKRSPGKCRWVLATCLALPTAVAVAARRLVFLATPTQAGGVGQASRGGQAGRGSQALHAR